MTDKPDWVRKLESEECTCVICDMCDGRGEVYYSVDGIYRGPYHWSDMDDSETCDYCLGGISEPCDRCILLEEYEREEEWW